MRKVGSREFKNRLGRYLQAVRKGQSIIITDRGQPVAKLSPPNIGEPAGLSLDTILQGLQAQGLLRIAAEPLKKLRQVPSRGKSAARMVLEDRA